MIVLYRFLCKIFFNYFKQNNKNIFKKEPEKTIRHKKYTPCRHVQNNCFYDYCIILLDN